MGVHNFHTDASKYNLWEEMAVMVRKREGRELREKCIFLYLLASQVFIKFSIATTQTNVSLRDNSSTQASWLISQVSILFRVKKKNQDNKEKTKVWIQNGAQAIQGIFAFGPGYASYDLCVISTSFTWMLVKIHCQSS